MSIDTLFETLGLPDEYKSGLWQAYVLRQALDAFGAYLSQDHLDRWPREDLEKYVKDALPKISKADLHALMVVAQVLEGAKVNI